MYSVILEDMCTKPRSGPNRSQSTKWMNGFRLYAARDIEHYQLMSLHEFVVNQTYYQENILRAHT